MNASLEKGAGCRGDPTNLDSHGRCRVLVVDDDPDAAEALAELLSMNGHDVRTATGADQALRLFPALQPQVAVLDIGLPVMDGYELQARMSKLPGGAECMYVALTGYGMKREQEQSGSAGFQAHLVKPVDLDQLARLIAGSMKAAASPGPWGMAGPPAGSR
jgi:CheY-like chemotaxis protein